MNNIIQLRKRSFAAVFFISLIVMSAVEAAPHPKQTQHDIRRGDSYDLENESSADSEKYDLQGSSSIGYGYYSYPYLGSGFYGGHYPYYGGIYGLGYPYYGGYYGGYHGFHGHYW
ncbi:scale keratin [Rhagoletis pomonella]|uniref:scale keratin n=1 Tax=Rhagoletis pomonella TaxID=28610 RepID=UPI00177EBB58|nr:scale keratin [Rhagoletis pomonella]